MLHAPVLFLLKYVTKEQAQRLSFCGFAMLHHSTFCSFPANRYRLLLPLTSNFLVERLVTKISITGICCPAVCEHTRPVHPCASRVMDLPTRLDLVFHLLSIPTVAFTWVSDKHESFDDRFDSKLATWIGIGEMNCWHGKSNLRMLRAQQTCM